ncbi:hypothetical protein D3C75_857520 [compost metagenome]
MVHVVYDRFHVACSRSGDYDLLRPAFQVKLGFFFRGEEACTFENDVYAKLAPRELFRVAVHKNLNLFAVNFEVPVMNFNVSVENALRCIIFEQMGQHFSVGKVVDGYNLDTFHILNTAESEPSDTSKTVNAYFYTH